MGIYRLLAVSYSVVIGGTVAVEAVIRYLNRRGRKEKEQEENQKDHQKEE